MNFFEAQFCQLKTSKLLDYLCGKLLEWGISLQSWEDQM